MTEWGENSAHTTKQLFAYTKYLLTDTCESITLWKVFTYRHYSDWMGGNLGTLQHSMQIFTYRHMWKHHTVESICFQIQQWIAGSVRRPADWKAGRDTHAGSSPRCGKGCFSQSQLSAQTLLRYPYSFREQSHALIIITDRFLYSAILRSLEQTHCARVWFYTSE